MKTFTLYGAAKECETSRPRLLRAIRTGELKATFDNENQQWQINLPDLLAAGFNPGKSSAPPEDEHQHEPNPDLQHELEMYKLHLASSEQIIRMQQQLIKAHEKNLEDLRTTLKALPQTATPATETKQINAAKFSANFSARFPTQIINRACRLIRIQSRRRSKSTIRTPHQLKKPSNHF